MKHLMYMDDIKVFAKNENELETLIQTLRIYSQDIGMQLPIEKCVMLKWKVEKEKQRKDQPDQERIRTLGEMEKYKYFRILEANTLKQDKGKNKKKVPRKTFWNHALWQKSRQRD